MVDQLEFPFRLPKIDSKKTQERVEETLEKVRVYRAMGFTRREMKTTPSYEYRIHGSTHAISRQAEDVAIWNVDREREYREADLKLTLAMRALTRRMRDVIEAKYLQQPDEFDYIVCQELGYSERTFRRIKTKALYRLADYMNLIVYEDEEKAS